MITKVEGIIISSTNYSESSKILKIFTKEYGVISVISKGCKKLKSKLRNISENFTYGYFHIYYKKDKLSVLITCDIINYFKSIKSDVIKIAYISYFCELSYNVYNNSEDSNVYKLLISSVLKIEKNFDPSVISNILEIKYLKYLGVEINLNGCIDCGSTNILTLNPYKGGYLCKECVTDEKIVDLKSLKMIKLYYYVDIENIKELNVSEKIKEEINLFLSLYYEQFTGLYIKSKKFLNDLLNYN